MTLIEAIELEKLVGNLHAWLELMSTNHASDLHVTVGQPLVMRIHGDLQTVGAEPLSLVEIESFLAQVLTPEAKQRFEQTHDLDFAFQTGQGRFRVNCLLNLHGPALVLRAIAANPPTLDQIAAPAILAKLTGLRNGLVIITGPTGSGKSSTLAAMVDHINRHASHHIVTLEDPVEFVHQARQSIITQREIGVHTQSFQSGLRAALREDPDVILVGELRDHETISLALTAAETGHLVFGTLHTNSAHRAVLRLIDSIPLGQRDVARAMLGNSLPAVIAQTLVPSQRGGRTAVFEILIGTHAVRNLIMEGQTAQLYSLMQMGARYHMQTMEMALDGLVERGEVDAQLAATTLQSLQGSSIADDDSQGQDRRQATNSAGRRINDGITF